MYPSEVKKERIRLRKEEIYEREMTRTIADLKDKHAQWLAARQDPRVDD